MSEQVVTDSTTVRHLVGMCPGCGVDLYADVDIVTEVHPPRLDREGKPQACTHARVVGSRIDHWCERDADGWWMSARADRDGGAA